MWTILYAQQKRLYIKFVSWMMFRKEEKSRQRPRLSNVRSGLFYIAETWKTNKKIWIRLKEFLEVFLKRVLEVRRWQDRFSTKGVEERTQIGDIKNGRKAQKMAFYRRRSLTLSLRTHTFTTWKGKLWMSTRNMKEKWKRLEHTKEWVEKNREPMERHCSRLMCRHTRRGLRT